MLFNCRKRILALGLCIITIAVFLKGETSSKYFMDFFEHYVHHLDLSPCDCHKCLREDDPWFMERFNKSVNPFLTRKNDLSEDAYRWWKGLQKDHSSIVAYRTTVEEVFQIFPEHDIFMDSSPGRSSRPTCAVVGNSGNLRGSHYGALIDAQDVIIRMNGAPIKGYQMDVGTRTTHHVMYPESAIDLENTTHLVLFAFKTLDLRWLISAFTTGSVTFTYAPVKAKIKANKDLVMVLNPAFIKYVYEIWLEKHGRYPSTGFLALMLGMHICDQVSVFGFGADSNGNWNHYWEELKNKKLRTGVHGGMYEYNLIKQLSDKQKLCFFRG